MSNPLLFEQVRSIIETLPIPKEENQRRYEKIPGFPYLAIARNSAGEYEFFLIGERITPRLSLISQNLRYDTWIDNSIDSQFIANRLLFPFEEHFEAITTLLVVEFSRQPSDLGLEEKFHRIEPLIEPFLRRRMISELEIIGLIGELVVLENLLSEASTDDFERVLKSWFGFQKSARDFCVSNYGIEVKTTRSNESSHHINNISQVEVRKDANGKNVEHLFLVSIGLNPASGDGLTTSINLRGKYEEISELLSSNPLEGTRLVQTFDEMVQLYGESDSTTYVHEEMKNHPLASKAWNVMFTRIFDMSDENLSLPRRCDFDNFHHVVADSFQFVINLPKRLTGDLNPSTDLGSFAKKIINNFA